MAADRAAAILHHVADQLAHAGVQVHRALASEISGNAKNELLEIRIERAMRRHLDAEILEHRHTAVARAIRRATSRTRSSLKPARVL